MRTKKIKHKPLSDDQYAKIIGQNPIIDLMLSTGLRIAETKRIVDEWDGKSKHIDIHTKKSGEDTNRIFLTPEARNAIRECGKAKMKHKSTKTYERRIYDTYLKNGLIKSLKGKKAHTSHTLRSTVGTRLFSNGVDPLVVQSIMNHSSLEQTAAYIHISEKRQVGALETLTDFETINGMTHREAIKRTLELDLKIKRLEEALKLERKKSKSLHKRVVELNGMEH